MRRFTQRERHAVRQRSAAPQIDDQRFPARRFKKTIEGLAPDAGRADIEGAFFGNVREALDDIPQLLRTGTSDATAAFEHHAESKAPFVARRIIGAQCIDKPTNKGLAMPAK